VAQRQSFEELPMAQAEGEDALVALKDLDQRRQMAGQDQKAPLLALIEKASCQDPVGT
jgi:hypothetical protein